MKHFTTLLLSSACALTLLSGCSGKDGDPGPAGATGAAGPTGAQGPAGTSGQNLTGNMFGFVSPVDEFGTLTAKNGVTVTLEGATPAVTATTNADGRYEFTTVRNGTYNLSFSRAGLVTTRRLSVAHVGGDQPTFLGTNGLTAPSTTTVGTISLSTFSGGVTVNVPFANVNAPFGYFNRLAFFVSASPGVNSSNGTLLFTTSSSSNFYSTSISRSNLTNLGFAIGTPVYLVVYGMPASFNTSVDPATGRTIYNGLSAVSLNQLAFIVP